MKRLGLGLGVAFVLVVTGLGYRIVGGNAKPVYLTSPVERGEIVSTVTATGIVNAVGTVEVSSQLSGQIAKLLADFNDEVKRGQPIAQLDQQRFSARVREAAAQLAVAQSDVLIGRASVDRARSALASARAQTAVIEARTASARATFTAKNNELERTQSLSAKSKVAASELDRVKGGRDAALADLQGATAAEAVHAETIAMAVADVAKSEAEAVNAEARVTQMEAALNQTEVDLERTVIRAPIEGVVIGRDVDRGQTVAASLNAPTLFTIARDLRQMELHARIDEADIGRIRVDQRASFTVDSFPGRSFAGTVVQIRKAPQVVQNVVTYTVVIATENPDLLLLPGMTALVRIAVAASGETLTLPSAALRYAPSDAQLRMQDAHVAASSDGGSAATVWLLDGDGRPQPIGVRVGLDDGGVVQLLAGTLEAGQAVVVGESFSEGDGSLFGLRFGF